MSDNEKPTRGLRFSFGETEIDGEKEVMRVEVKLMDRFIGEVARQLAVEMQKDFAAVLLEFHVREGRWPEWAWFEDWRCMGSMNPFKPVRVPQAYCSDTHPTSPSSLTIYETGELNRDPEKASLFQAELERVLATNPKAGGS